MSEWAEPFKLLIAHCKDNAYNDFIDELARSEIELLKADADARRSKASEHIRGAQKIELEIKRLTRVYENFKRDHNIDSIPYFEQFISELERERRAMLREKNKLK